MNKKELLENILMPKDEKILSRELDNKKDILFEIIPELKEEDGFDQKNSWHIYDVWQHTLKALESSKPYLDVRIALLFHDIGKPYSYQEENGIRHFKGHSKKSAEITKPILEKLGYGKNEVNDIVYLIKKHSTTIDIKNVNKENIELTKKLLYVQFCDASAYNPLYIQSVFEKLNEIGQQLIEKEKEYEEEEQR